MMLTGRGDPPLLLPFSLCSHNWATETAFCREPGKFFLLTLFDKNLVILFE